MTTALNHSWQEGRNSRTEAAVAEFSRVAILGTSMYQPQLNAKPDTVPGAVAVKETGV